MSSFVRLVRGDWLVGVGRRLMDGSRLQVRNHSEVPSCWGSILPSRDPDVSWPTSIGQDVLAQRWLHLMCADALGIGLDGPSLPH